MLNNYIVFFDVIICLVFVFIANRSEKLGLLITVFSLSFLVPFQNSFFPMGLPGAFVIILIFLRFFGKLKNRIGHKTLIKFDKSKYLYYLLFAGILIGLYNTAQGIEFPDINKLPNLIQIYDLSTYLITILCFINVLMYYGLDFKFQDKLIRTFCFGILVHFVLYLLFKNVSYSSRLFVSMSSENEMANVNEMRFLSLIGDYELTIDYVFITICFCLISFYRDKKKYHLLLILLSIFIGVVTGTRSFLVIAAFYLMAILLSNIKKFKLVIFLLLVSVPIITFSNIWPSLTEEYTVFARFDETLYQFNNNQKVEKLTNRDFSKASSDLISNTNILGNGSFYFYKFNGNEMVSHNVFLAMYAKFGLPGLLILLGLLFYNLNLLISIIKRPKKASIKKEATLYLIILVGLIMQELKISALRNISVLLIYTFLFYNIYCMYLRKRDVKINRVVLEN
jgi:O-antigen ligase